MGANFSVILPSTRLTVKFCLGGGPTNDLGAKRVMRLAGGCLEAPGSPIEKETVHGLRSQNPLPDHSCAWLALPLCQDKGGEPRPPPPSTIPIVEGRTMFQAARRMEE